MQIDPLQRNHVTVCGKLDAARSIVFVHGLGTDQSAWRAVAAPFMADFRIVLLDNVGAGQSDPQAFRQHRYLTLAQYATDLVEVCEALALTDAVLVGHSSGAMVGALATLRAPGRFSRLVMIGASPRYLDDNDYRGGFTKQDVDALYQRVLRVGSRWTDSFAPAMMGNPDRPELSARFAEALNAIPRNEILTVLCSILQSDHRQDMARLSIPTLIIHTAHDNSVPFAVAEYLHHVIAGSQLVVIDADGHLPHVSAPDRVVDAIAPFVRG